MSKTINDLPRELFSTILEYLVTTKARLTCKKYQPSVEKLYLESNLTVTNFTTAGQLIKRIAISKRGFRLTTKDYQDLVLNIFKHCPNIVEQATTGGLLESLKLLPVINYLGDLQRYAHVALMFRNTLEKLVISDKKMKGHGDGSRMINSEVFDKLALRLGEFPKISSLIVQRIGSTKREVLFELNSLIEACPKLVSYYPKVFFDPKGQSEVNIAPMNSIRSRPYIKTLEEVDLIICSENSKLKSAETGGNWQSSI